MGKIYRPLVFVSAAFLSGAGAPAQAVAVPGLSADEAPILFEANRGQYPAEVRFQARAAGWAAGVLADGLVLDLEGAGLRMRFLGTEDDPQIEGREPHRARAHFLSAASATRDVPTFTRVRLSGLYPGVDLELYESAGRLEYDFLLEPWADASAVRVVLEGGTTTIDGEGALCTDLGGPTLRQPLPRAWQEDAQGCRTPIDCRWFPFAGGGFGFRLDERDEGSSLVIDPVLVYGTHVGGSNADQARAVFVDDLGFVYVTGWSRSVDFPLTGADPGRTRRGKEAVVFKFGPDGRELVYSTTLGGRGDDLGVAIQVTAKGEAIVAGNTQSDDFPTTENAFERESSGGEDGFVVRLSADGSSLLLGTFLGGSAEDTVNGLALTDGGQITLAGTTRSRDFPVSSSSYCVQSRGGRDAFLTRLDPTCERLIFSTRLGGSEDDEGLGLAVDSEGCSYITGRTVSHDFPTTLGAFDRSRCGVDGFVVKLSAGGRTLLYSTFLGGSGQDVATAIAVDGAMEAVVVGWTHSLDFPFQSGSPAPGRGDGFAVRLSEMGNTLRFSRAIGGGSVDEALGVTLDQLGAAWVVGWTRSSDFPLTADSHQGYLAGSADAFLARLAPSDGTLLYGTLLGGVGADELCGVHADGSGGSIVVCGFSEDIPMERRGDLAGKRRGPSDAYVLRFDPRAVGPVTPSGADAGIGFGF